ncbi:helix-turn-helix domain-containing protein [Crystallibacter degradans]|uniref:helix-turn-helix domain-containing protein n=1 Tax=Crystallibacter degradans TaxID=2726743 RepID=UPI001473A5A4|nr:helix-turn-helix domain-containing protein [Arthrobacter sp. SF27]NMR32063.1 helix-turn-helix domain-containing protein [Arthrobacter sp. SF27]
MTDTPAQRRFLKLDDVMDILNISRAQTYALVRSGDLEGIQIGGRNIWRVEETKLQEFIDESYRKTAQAIAKGEIDDEPAED